jgi:transcription elongation factor S-II
MITVAVLSKTLIGKTVAEFKSYDACSETREVAKSIVKAWRKVAEAEASSPSAPSSSKPAPPASKPPPPSADTSSEPPSKKAKPDASAGLSMSRDSSISSLPSRSASASDEMTSYVASLSPASRGKVLTAIRDSLCKASTGPDADNSDTTLSEMSPEALLNAAFESAKSIESAIASSFAAGGADYVAKYRQLSYNLSRNSELRARVITGVVEGLELVSMTDEQLLTKEKNAHLAKLKEQQQAARRSDWKEANAEAIDNICGIGKDSLYKCSKCGSQRTSNYQKQMRSSDEPMTVFITCRDCGKRWRE